jgi:hypothetical protein
VVPYRGGGSWLFCVVLGVGAAPPGLGWVSLRSRYFARGNQRPEATTSHRTTPSPSPSQLAIQVASIHRYIPVYTRRCDRTTTLLALRLATCDVDLPTRKLPHNDLRISLCLAHQINHIFIRSNHRSIPSLNIISNHIARSAPSCRPVTAVISPDDPTRPLHIDIHRTSFDVPVPCPVLSGSIR